MRDLWRVRGRFGGSYELEPYPDRSDSSARDESVREASRLVRAFDSDPGIRRVLLEVYARMGGVSCASASRQIGEELLAAARAGHLVVRRREERIVVVPLEEAAEEVLGPEPEPTAWIEVELVDQDGKPVPAVDYRIECDDGRVRTGVTNASGRGREDGLHPGNCKVSFPRLHGPDWKAA